MQCIQAHDSEVVCLDYSPLAEDGRFWLASGSRDRLTQIYECEHSEEYQTVSQYRNVAILDDHSSTITSIRFTEEKGAPKKRLKLVSSGADKQIVMRTITPGNETEQFTAVLAGKEQCKSKVFSLDVACGHTVTGHDKYMQMWTGTLDKEWERKAESQKKQAVLDHLKVAFGPL